MADEEKRPESDNAPEEDTGSTPPEPEKDAGAPSREPEEAPEAVTADAGLFDIAQVPATVGQIVINPAKGLVAGYRPGQHALITGLILGAASGVLIPLIDVMVVSIKYGSGASPSAGHVLKQCLGGLVFLAAGAALTFLLRRSIAKSTAGSWQADVYLVGGAMVFLLAAAVAGGICGLIGGEFFNILASVCKSMGLVLAAFCLLSGLMQVGEIDAGAAVWIGAGALAVALLASGLLYFSPVGQLMYAGGSAASSALNEMNEMLEHLKQ